MRGFIKNELSGWSKIEVFWLAVATLIITGLSIYWKDTTMGIISSLTGVVCVVLTGKGKLSCYMFGLVNTVLYAIIAYQVRYYGDFMLNAFYYLPMQFVGFYMWNKHMNVETNEVIAERMDCKSRLTLFAITGLAVIVYGYILQRLNGSLPYVDSISTVLSVVAMYLSVKRYMEQWIMWIVVDVVSVIMWIVVFAQGQESIATLLMWSVYLINAIVMFVRWNKSSKEVVA